MISQEKCFSCYTLLTDHINNCLLGSVKLTKHADPDRYKYSGYSIGFDSCSGVSFTDRNMGENVTIFGADTS